MYSTNNTTNNCVTTNSTTTLRKCELCEDYISSKWYNFTATHLPFSKASYLTDDDWHFFCDKHKKEYDIKLKMKLRKDKIQNININI